MIMSIIFIKISVNIERSEPMSHLEKLELYQRIINELRPFEGEMLKQIKEFYQIGRAHV